MTVTIREIQQQLQAEDTSLFDTRFNAVLATHVIQAIKKGETFRLDPYIELLESVPFNECLVEVLKAVKSEVNKLVGSKHLKVT